MTAKITTSFSLRTRLFACMLTMAIAGFSLVLITGYIFRDIAYQNQRNAITELIGLKITNILDELAESSKLFGMELQSMPELRTAIKKEQLIKVRDILDTQFKRYYVTTGKLKLKDIYVFDEDFEFLINSSNVNPDLKDHPEMLSCSNMTLIARKRAGAQRLKPMGQLCTRNYESLYGIIVPVGSLDPFAYMLLILDPAHNVAQLEETLGDPVRILRYGDTVVYESPNWPKPEKMDDYLIAQHILRAPNGTTLLKTQAARDIEPYRNQLREYTIIITITSLVIFGFVLGALIFTMRKTLKPLDELKSAANELGKGKLIKVDPTNIPELNVLISSYNKMAEEITSLIRKLKNEILGHKKTESNLKQHQYDLSLARDQAYAASRAKSTFLANMSHELRTPLNAIIGYADLMFEEANESANQQQKSDLEKILASGQHLLTIIDNVLDLSKIESGELVADPFDVRIDKLIHDLGIAVKPMAELNHNTLEVNCKPGIGLAFTDEKKLRQCLLNVLDNACKFTRHGQVAINVDEERKNEQEWLIFSVIDTGIGIDEEQSRKIFSEFTQADSSTTKTYSGIGIGLSLSKKYCELLEGHITFVSEAGKGSTFIISIPKRLKQNLRIDFDGNTHSGNAFSRSA